MERVSLSKLMSMTIMVKQMATLIIYTVSNSHIKDRQNHEIKAEAACWGTRRWD